MVQDSVSFGEFGAADSAPAAGGLEEQKGSDSQEIDYSPGSDAPSQLELLSVASGEPSPLIRMDRRTELRISCHLLPTTLPSAPQTTSLRISALQWTDCAC